MTGIIITFLLTVEQIYGRELIASQTTRSSITISSVSNVQNPSNNYATLEYTTISELKYIQSPEKTFQSERDTSDRDGGSSTSQSTNRNQDRKSSRLFLSCLIIASMNQYPNLNSSVQVNVKNSTSLKKNCVENNKSIFKDEQLTNAVKTGTVNVTPNTTSVTFPDEAMEQRNNQTEARVTVNTNENTTENSNNTNTNIKISLEDRSSFVGDKCPTGYAKVNGKCVLIKE